LPNATTNVDAVSCTRLLPTSPTYRSPDTGSVLIAPGFSNWPSRALRHELVIL
jgi:hypothetical protein